MKSDLFQERYLFHFHTPLTDGSLELEDYFAYAQKHDITQVIPLEHIRKNPGYDPESFASDLKRHSEKWQIKAFLGFEAKIMPDASLNIDDDLIERSDVIGIAEHAFPDDFPLFCDALENIFQSYPKKFPHVQFVWVHPGLWLRKKKRLDHDCYSRFLQMAIKNEILIEESLRYNLPSEEYLHRVPDESRVVGADAHSLLDLNRFTAYLYRT